MSHRAKLRLLVALVMPVAVAGPSQQAWAADEAQPGRALYLKYCGACHGPDAKGDGVAGSLMQPKPADLTKLSARYGGEFPMEQVVRTIDGRQALHAHGEPAMPVWGEVLSDQHGSGDKQRPAIERRVQSRIFLIVDYLRTIQAP